MLPAGLAAQPAEPGEAAKLRHLVPAAQTAAVLLVGGCSCDLVRPRHPDSREDERHLRDRYRKLGLPRSEIIRQLERHRRGGPAGRQEPGAWAAALAAFVAEHARNAGPTLYYLRFGPPQEPAPPPGAPVTLRVADVRGAPDRWLNEQQPVLVVR